MGKDTNEVVETLDVFGSENLLMFSIGSSFSAKLVGAFANANMIVENGGYCEIRFKFGHSKLAGTMHYAKKRGNINKTVIFKDIYELLDATVYAVE